VSSSRKGIHLVSVVIASPPVFAYSSIFDAAAGRHIGGGAEIASWRTTER